MKRRQALASLLGAAGAVSLTDDASAQSLSPDAVRGLLRSLAGVEPMPGEEASALAFLLSMRRPRIDPEVEPAITFVP